VVVSRWLLDKLSYAEKLALPNYSYIRLEMASGLTLYEPVEHHCCNAGCGARLSLNEVASRQNRHIDVNRDIAANCSCGKKYIRIGCSASDENPPCLASDWRRCNVRESNPAIAKRVSRWRRADSE
jgi:hypothetical protein